MKRFTPAFRHGTLAALIVVMGDNASASSHMDAPLITLDDAANTTIQGPAGSGGTVAVGNTGGSQPLYVQDPFLAVNYIICLQGIFPSRN